MAGCANGGLTAASIDFCNIAPEPRLSRRDTPETARWMDQYDKIRACLCFPQSAPEQGVTCPEEPQ